ncbi:MAG: DUF3179 domain-containing (seleno)protein, partial [Vicinamibacterales bacterium]
MRAFLALAVAGLAAGMPAGQPGAPPPLTLFYDAASLDDDVADAALEALGAAWRDAYTSMIIDMVRLMPPPRRVDLRGDGFPDDVGPDGEPLAPGAGRGAAFPPPPRVSPQTRVRGRLLRFLERQTGRRFDEYLVGWRQWMWTLPYDPHPGYAEFKGAVYSQVDPRMALFFPPGTRSSIRLDEVDWGGVAVNGIPPLYHPKTLPAGEARYLRDGNVVFGLVVNGEARAYPKRVLAWHEMAVDRVGGVELTVVYCTLCGTVIPYESTVEGRVLRFGTSGLLYRSNKLMFDEDTGSLWSTLEGRPVIGPLAAFDVALVSYPVVTTTWGEWKAMHPGTSVLSLDTGHERDYAEGAAYRDYFSHDRLYFQVARQDDRLGNKAEVLTLKVRPAAGPGAVPVAIDADFLDDHPVYHLEVQGRRMVVVTSRRGANRVYAMGSAAVAFESVSRDGLAVVDSAGRRWRVTEEALVGEGEPVVRLPRVVAQRAF